MQKTILSEYRQLFPNHTIRQISRHTGVQMTRVFRLLNGYEMKTKEFEAFNRCIQAKKNPKSDLIDGLLNQAKEILPDESVAFIHRYIESKMAMQRISKQNIKRISV